MLRLLHLADVHLGAQLGSFGQAAAERARDVLRAFRALPEIARAEGAHAVAIAGDLFDGPEPPADVRAAAADTVRRLAADGRPVFVVPGNHDSHLLAPSPWREAFGGATVFLAPSFGPPAAVETGAGWLRVYGFGYDPASEPDPLSTFRRDPGPGVHVALVHGSVKAVPHWTSSPNVLRLTTAGLRALEVDYVALGDHHAHRGPAEAAPGAPACYPGSFAACDFTEHGPRGLVVADLEPGRPPRVRLVPSGVAPVVDAGQLDASRAESEADVVEALAARVPDGSFPTVTLVGEPSWPLDAERVQLLAVARFGAARVVDRTTVLSAALTDEIARRDTVAGHVVRLGRERAAAAPDERARRVADRALRIALRALEART
jgi:DNA repair exonuclease SbcCD nuclease subunit